MKNTIWVCMRGKRDNSEHCAVCPWYHGIKESHCKYIEDRKDRRTIHLYYERIFKGYDEPCSDSKKECPYHKYRCIDLRRLGDI